MWLCDLVSTQNIGDKSLCNGSKDTFKRLFFYDAFIIPYQVKLSFKHVSRWSGALFNFCHVMKAILKSAIRMNVIFSHINASYLLSTDREKCSYCEALSFFDYPLFEYAHLQNQTNRKRNLNDTWNIVFKLNSTFSLRVFWPATLRTPKQTLQRIEKSI